MLVVAHTVLAIDVLVARPLPVKTTAPTFLYNAPGFLEEGFRASSLRSLWSSSQWKGKRDQPPHWLSVLTNVVNDAEFLEYGFSWHGTSWCIFIFEKKRMWFPFQFFVLKIGSQIEVGFLINSWARDRRNERRMLHDLSAVYMHAPIAPHTLNHTF